MREFVAVGYDDQWVVRMNRRIAIMSRYRAH
jgi:hypothetical protein